jgi:hypothetical protein
MGLCRDPQSEQHRRHMCSFITVPVHHMHILCCAASA